MASLLSDDIHSHSLKRLDSCCCPHLIFVALLVGFYCYKNILFEYRQRWFVFSLLKRGNCHIRESAL